MANTHTCGTCQHMWHLQKGKRGGKTVKLTRGQCLVRTVFPKNRPGNMVYPPGAVIRDTPYNVIESFVVRADQIVPYCTDHSPR